MPFPCESCQSLAINGIPCHETGCPDAWRDRPYCCGECGADFIPESRQHRLCPDCANPPEPDMQVCSDCIMVIANCDESGIDDPERLEAVRAGIDRIGNVIPGHSLGFSWRGCDCCGSHLGGDSFAVFTMPDNATTTKG